MTGNSEGALTRGVNHLGLTVPELAITADFSSGCLGLIRWGEAGLSGGVCQRWPYNDYPLAG